MMHLGFFRRTLVSVDRRQVELADMAPQLVVDDSRRATGIDGGEVIDLGHAVQCPDQALLIADEALVHVLAETEVHAALPVVEMTAPDDHAGNQVVHIGPQVVDRVGNQAEPCDVPDPGRIFVPSDGPRHNGKDIAVGQDHETGAQSGDDLILQAVGKIGDVVQGHGHRAEGVTFFGLLDALPRQRRPGHAGIQNRVSFLLEPGLQGAHLGGTADRVRPFYDDELSLQLRHFDAGQRFAEGFERFHAASHGAGTRGARNTPSLRLRPRWRSTMERISRCWSSIDRVASMMWKPTSLAMPSYSSRMRPWKIRKLSSTSRLSPRSWPAS